MTDNDRQFQEALDATVDAMIADPSLSFDNPKLPHNQYFVNFQLSELEKHFKDDGFYLMKAIALCARHCLPLPEWVSLAFLDGFYRNTLGEENSWDAVFGAPYPKGTKMPPLEKKRKLRLRCYEEVAAIKAKHPSVAIDSYLYNVIAKKLGIGKDAVRENYKFVKELFEDPENGQVKIHISSKMSRCQLSRARLPETNRRKKKKTVKKPDYSPAEPLLNALRNGLHFYE